MAKRVLGISLAVLIILSSFTLVFAASPNELTAEPKDVLLPEFTTFKDGDKLIITDRAGGGVYYDPMGKSYSVSAMNATKSGGGNTFYAWCASYGVSTPLIGREYTLHSSDTAGYLTVDGEYLPLVYCMPSVAEYYYYDIGLKDYISFNWAMSCIKAAETLAGTTELSFAWRMAIELAIRSDYLDVNVSVSDYAYFGSGIIQHFTEADCDTVAEFMDRTKSIIEYANRNIVFWSPYVEEIAAREILAQNQYDSESGYFILLDAYLNNGNCEISNKRCSNGVEVSLDYDRLTVKIPIEKLPINGKISWEFEIELDAGYNYNMLYGKPSNGGIDVQNIMVYDVSNINLRELLRGEYDTEDEKAPITVQKTDIYGEPLEGVGFTLYTVDASNKIKPYVDFPTKQTTDAGLVTWSQLELGTYFLEESAPPSNMVGARWAVEKAVGGVTSPKQGLEEVTLYDSAGKAHKGVIVELTPGTSNVTFTVLNELNEVGAVVVIKDDYHGDPLADMSFTLYPVNGNALGDPIKTLLTKSMGMAAWRELDLGEYFIAENYLGSGYVPYEPENWYVSGAEDAEYTIIDGIGGWRFTLDGTTNIKVYATNKKVTGELTINKTTDDGIAEPFKFLITSDTGYSYTATLVPNTNEGYSSVTVKDLEVYKEDGNFITYTVTEVDVPDRYVPPAPKSFTFEGKATSAPSSSELKYTVSFNNSLKAVSIVVVKTSYNGRIKDIEFTLKGSNGYSVTSKTDSTGKITFTGLLMYNGNEKVTYTLSENVSNVGSHFFVPVFSSDTLVLTGGVGVNGTVFEINKYEQAQEIRVFNPAPSMEIGGVKTSELGAREGFTFVLTGSNGYNSEPFITDATGEFYFGGLQSYTTEGKPIVYTLTELPTDLFKPMEPMIFDPSKMTGTSPSLTILNELKDGEIVITKNAEDGVVQGVKFHITSDYLDDPIEIETDENGRAVFAGLDVYKDGKYITYTVTEVDVPGRYQASQFSKSFTFENAMQDAAEEDVYFTVETEAFNTLKRLTLELLKEDVDGNVLAGAEFIIEYSADGGETWAALTTDVCAFTSEQYTEGVFRSDENGNVVVENLYAHYQYRITETKAPDGYMLWSERIPVSVDVDNSADVVTVRRTVVNNRKPTLPNTGESGFGYISIAVLTLCLVGWLGLGKRKNIKNI